MAKGKEATAEEVAKTIEEGALTTFSKFVVLQHAR